MLKKDSLYSVISFIYYFVYISVVFFMAPFLLSKSLAQTTIGYISSLSIALLVISLLVGGVLSDIKIKNKSIILYNIFMSIISIFLLLYFDNKNILMIAYFLLLSNFIMIPAFLDGLVIKEVKKINVVRSIGSLGAAFGYFLNYWILNSILLFNLLVADVFLLILLFIIIYKIDEHTIVKIHDYNIKTIFSDKFIIIILCISFLTYGVLAADDPYTVMYNTQIANIGNKVSGIIGFISIIIEAIIVLSIYKILKVVSIKKLLFLCCTILIIIFGIRAFLYDSRNLVIISNLLIGVFTGIYIPLILIIVNKYTFKEVRNSVLSFYLICIKLGGSVVGFITTYIYMETNFLPSIYIFHLLLVMVALLLILKIKEKI